MTCQDLDNKRTMAKTIVTAGLLALAVLAGATDALAQATRRKPPPKPPEPPAPAMPIDKRDSVVTTPGLFNGRPYWLALAECGGIYFKLNIFYTDAAVHARVGKPDPHANAEFSKKLKEAIEVATTYFDGAEHFLMAQRGLERTDAVLTYDKTSRAAGDRLKSIDAALAAAKDCPAVYHACQEAFSKQCSEPLSPLS
jgi:hypothetical protein